VEHFPGLTEREIKQSNGNNQKWYQSQKKWYVYHFAG
jgi:hypothetical protein